MPVADNLDALGDHERAGRLGEQPKRSDRLPPMPLDGRRTRVELRMSEQRAVVADRRPDPRYRRRESRAYSLKEKLSDTLVSQRATSVS
jgi:hypothetical protein